MRILIASVTSTLTMVAAAQAQDVQQGYQLALEVCASCHAVVAGQLQSPVPEAPSFEEIAATPGMTAAALNFWLTAHDHPTMPRIKLSQDEVRDVSAYVLGLKE
ncbi:MAG: c-type cytochrome [Mesorhizobium sp.]|uniref:c-type cytochrome n=1 Tax=unclassified Mesorhizobium TaxID=325217 RepID=UPI000FCBF050|nr:MULTISPECIES: c-type cytochrome [unclassified Mesorhizobium]RUV74804.1 c-type cytochrome [Mesorhizobium sp. M5C.F.Cr.IN.023.01.1.1]RWF88689.1 MAG: c-type cytochrome [Mesorhizobium sp.]RWF92920.1 MAG: c-type cytochrome [Mesorhizobium sp.]RWI41242.1 MAG: c-type cytochrome [Mesorhizobium sp.]RWI49765.1 MAG: c-type cytochrome [Mesorhizobium sp.]